MALACPKWCHLEGKDVNKVHGFNVIDQRYEGSGTRFVEMGRECGRGGGGRRKERFLVEFNRAVYAHVLVDFVSNWREYVSCLCEHAHETSGPWNAV